MQDFLKSETNQEGQRRKSKNSLTKGELFIVIVLDSSFLFLLLHAHQKKKKGSKEKENQCVRLEFVRVSRHISRYFEAEMYLKTLQFYVSSSAKGAHSPTDYTYLLLYCTKFCRV